MLVDIVTILGLIAVIVALPVAIVRAVRGSRRHEWRVRDWARENGYAILTIKHHGSLFGDIGIPFCSGPHCFKLLMQDDQGGQTNVTVFVGKPGKPVDVRWG